MSIEMMKIADVALNLVIFLITLVIVVRFFRKEGKWAPERGRFAFRFFTTQSNVLCACAALDSNGKIPEPLPIRQVREAFLYETFDEAWDKLHEDLQEGIKALDKLREDAQAQGSDLGNKDHMLLIQLNSLRRP